MKKSGILKILMMSAALAVTAPFPCPRTWPQADNSMELMRKTILYQIDISTQTADHIQEIFNKFNDSFIDYQPAIEEINILINEYNKAMQQITIPADGEKLHSLMKKLLSRVEKYFVYYKYAGRENPYINLQIFEIADQVAREAARLTSAYGP